MFNYKIPDDIKTKIPNQLMHELVLQLNMVFPNFSDDEINFITGTFGWNDAFTAACSECGCDWLADYADKLKWYDWDLFASELTDMALGL